MPWLTRARMVWVDGSGGEFELTHDLQFRDWGGRVWVTKAGTRSDLSSIPWWFRWRVSKARFGKAPFLHDDLYRNGGAGVSRKLADKLYYQGCIDEEIERVGGTDYADALKKGMQPWKIMILHRGLGLGGWWTWRKHRKRSNGEH